MSYLSKIIFPSIALLLMGCANDSTEDIVGTPIAAGTNVTYNQNVASIVNNNCVVCHASTPVNGAPMSLVTYAQVKQAVLERGLLDRISRDNGQSGLMPNGGPRMAQATIDVIFQWNAQNLQE